MIKKHFYSCLLLFLAVGLTTSCIKDVIMDAMEDPQLVVVCVLKVDSVQNLTLSYTKGASRSEAPHVTDATAILADLTEGVEAGRFERISERDWQLEYAAIPGHHYRLDVTVPGREPVWAEQTMPRKPISGAGAGWGYTPDEYPWLNLGIDRLTDYVSWVDGITFGDVIVGGSFYHIDFSCPIWAYVKTFDAELEQYVPVGQLCTDYPYVDDINLDGATRQGAGVPDFVNSPNLAFGTYRDNYLTGYAMHRDFLRFPPREDWKQLLEDGKPGPYFFIDGNFNDDATNISFQSRVYFDALSEDYDHYLCEAYMQYNAELSTDMSTIYLRDNTYTNIHGGLGIFGCVTRMAENFFGDEIGGYIWARPSVRIQVFGPQYDPENNDVY